MLAEVAVLVVLDVVGLRRRRLGRRGLPLRGAARVMLRRGRSERGEVSSHADTPFLSLLSCPRQGLGAAAGQSGGREGGGTWWDAGGRSAWPPSSGRSSLTAGNIRSDCACACCVSERRPESARDGGGGLLGRWRGCSAAGKIAGRSMAYLLTTAIKRIAPEMRKGSLANLMMTVFRNLH